MLGRVLATLRCTRARAVSSFSLRARNRNQELHTTVLAVGLLRTQSRAILANDIQLSISKALRKISFDVAPMTGRDKILRSIVQPIVIQVVNYKRIATRSAAILPLNFRSTPVARVLAWADTVIQYGTMLGDSVCAVRKRMSRKREYPIVAGDFLIRLLEEVTATGNGAEPSLLSHRMGLPAKKRGAAVFTNAFDLSHADCLSCFISITD